MTGDTAVSTRRLTKFYGGQRGIEDLDLDVQPEEVFGFLGPNGAGKTTTIRMLLGLIRPTRGEATILGTQLVYGEVGRRADIGYLPGDLALYGRMTGEQLLGYVARLRGGVTPERYRCLAERLGLDLTRRVQDLSRGNRQKIGLILAVFHEPEVLVLDEPTSGLDPLMQEEFLALVHEERERGCAVFLSSHELDEVQRVCDRVGIIREGRLVAVERVSDLLEKTPRRVSVEFGEPADLERLRGLSGVSGLEAGDGRVSFKVAGDIDPVIKAIARHRVVDVEIARPTLEEVFLTYYRRGAG